MSQNEPPLIYVVLGASGSGRRPILADLIDGGLAEDERAVVLLSSTELPFDRENPPWRLVRWTWSQGEMQIPLDAIGDATHVFLLTDGWVNPVDQIESFKAWLERSGGELARVITIVNCQAAEQHKELVPWYEACIHFSDVVLLARREGVANKWLSDFQARFKDQFYPCLFEFVKEGRVKNPPLLLEPQARRMSHLFDEPDWEILDEEDLEEGSEDEEGRETNEEIEVVAEMDPYLERRAGGRRVKEIPDIRKVLGQLPPQTQPTPAE
ncbi:hypothetical protein DB347_12210 [Opitutaceae bacterium EW11]|nr:hypothetical protein DB347_12210 [Opitutaceae bacterium EW11]